MTVYQAAQLDRSNQGRGFAGMASGEEKSERKESKKLKKKDVKTE